VTGLEVLAILGGCFLVGASALAAWVHAGERRKRLFLAHVSTYVAEVDDVVSGDVHRPLSFTVEGTRVRAVLRGDVEVWQLERVDAGIQATPLAVVQRHWHAPDVRSLPTVDALNPRLDLYAGDERGARTFLARARGDLCSVLGRRTRRCVVGPGRAFLEVSRRGLAVEELKDALARLDGLIAVLAGQAPRLSALGTSGAEGAEHGVAGPGGAVVPGFT
jgi:hypothetical protein